MLPIYWYVINLIIAELVLNNVQQAMASHVNTIASSIQQTKGHMEDIETKMSGLVAVMPYLGNSLSLLKNFRWPAVLVLMTLAGWRAAVLLAVTFGKHLPPDT